VAIGIDSESEGESSNNAKKDNCTVPEELESPSVDKEAQNDSNKTGEVSWGKVLILSTIPENCIRS
jgi:hypothetical protein